MARTYYVVREAPRLYYDRFFHAIKERPALWDPSHASFNDDKANYNLWKEVAVMVGAEKAKTVHFDFLRMRKAYEKFLCGRRDIWNYAGVMSFLGTNLILLKNTEKKQKRKKNTPPALEVAMESAAPAATASSQPAAAAPAVARPAAGAEVAADPVVAAAAAAEEDEAAVAAAIEEAEAAAGVASENSEITGETEESSSLESTDSLLLLDDIEEENEDDEGEGEGEEEKSQTPLPVVVQSAAPAAATAPLAAADADTELHPDAYADAAAALLQLAGVFSAVPVSLQEPVQAASAVEVENPHEGTQKDLVQFVRPDDPGPSAPIDNSPEMLAIRLQDMIYYSEDARTLGAMVSHLRTLPFYPKQNPINSSSPGERRMDEEEEDEEYSDEEDDVTLEDGDDVSESEEDEEEEEEDEDEEEEEEEDDDEVQLLETPESCSLSDEDDEDIQLVEIKTIETATKSPDTVEKKKDDEVQLVETIPPKVDTVFKPVAPAEMTNGVNGEANQAAAASAGEMNLMQVPQQLQQQQSLLLQQMQPADYEQMIRALSDELNRNRAAEEADTVTDPQLAGDERAEALEETNELSSAPPLLKKIDEADTIETGASAMPQLPAQSGLMTPPALAQTTQVARDECKKLAEAGAEELPQSLVNGSSSSVVFKVPPPKRPAPTPAASPASPADGTPPVKRGRGRP
ncbi:hypothetical protein PFISCL1PPCAC_25636, partial [Pristionchus fissidentatus]